MRIEKTWCLVCAAAIAAQIAALAALPFELAEPWDKVWHFLAYAGVTLFLWIGVDGRRPQGVVLSVVALAALEEAAQGWIPARSADASDFLTGFIAAVSTAIALSLTRG